VDAGNALLEVPHGGGHGGKRHDAGIDMQIFELYTIPDGLVDDPLRNLDLFLGVRRDPVLVAGQTDDIPVGAGDQREDRLAFVALFVHGIYHTGLPDVSLLQDPRQQLRIRAVDAERRVCRALYDADQPDHRVIFDIRGGTGGTVQIVGARLRLRDGTGPDHFLIALRDRLLHGRDRAVYFFADDNQVSAPPCNNGLTTNNYKLSIQAHDTTHRRIRQRSKKNMSFLQNFEADFRHFDK